jgi:hypothetical protein
LDFTSKPREARSCLVVRRTEHIKIQRLIRTIRTTPSQLQRKRMNEIESKESIKKKKKNE